MHHNLGLGMQLGLKGNKIICLVVFFSKINFFLFVLELVDFSTPGTRLPLNSGGKSRLVSRLVGCTFPPDRSLQKLDRSSIQLFA